MHGSPHDTGTGLVTRTGLSLPLTGTLTNTGTTLTLDGAAGGLGTWNLAGGGTIGGGSGAEERRVGMEGGGGGLRDGDMGARRRSGVDSSLSEHVDCGWAVDAGV